MLARLLGLKTISPAALHDLMKQNDIAVIDVNSEQSFVKGHVPGERTWTLLITRPTNCRRDRIGCSCSIARIPCAGRRRPRRAVLRASGTRTFT